MGSSSAQGKFGGRKPYSLFPPRLLTWTIFLTETSHIRCDATSGFMPNVYARVSDLAIKQEFLRRSFRLDDLDVLQRDPTLLAFWSGAPPPSAFFSAEGQFGANENSKFGCIVVLGNVADGSFLLEDSLRDPAADTVLADAPHPSRPLAFSILDGDRFSSRQNQRVGMSGWRGMGSHLHSWSLSDR